jgi:class 3 adenylate cyclase
MPGNNLFAKEESVVATIESRLADVPLADAEGRENLSELLREYRKLLKVTRRLMRLSDRNEQELRSLRTAAETAKTILSRYFSPNLAKELVDDPGFLNIGGERRELTFLFTDLADFTALVEQLEPAVIVPLLNQYLDAITQIVFRHGGTTEKIVGDAVHVIFGAPLEQPDQAARGVACALEIDAFAESFRQQKAAEGILLGRTRIGLHSGSAIVGNFGGELFFDYTAHGDAINTTARLESVNKHLGTRICASAAVVAKVPGFSGRPVGTLVLKGKTVGLEVFEPLTLERTHSAAMKAYCAAFKKLATNDASAKQEFAAIVAHFGEDPLTIFHLVRLLAGKSGVQIVFDEK